MTPIRVRDARPEDAGRVLDMVLALSLAEGETEPLATLESVARDMIGAQARTRVLVAEADGALAGYVSLLPAYESRYASPGIYIADLFVAADFRRRGIARALMAATAALSQAEGGGHIWLVRRADNAEGAKFYDTVADVADPAVAHAVTRDAFAALAGEGRAFLDAQTLRPSTGDTM